MRVSHAQKPGWNQQECSLERNESEPVQDDPTFETQGKDSELRDNPLDNETALLKFCSMLKALFLPCTSLALLQPITAYTNTKVQGTY